MQIIDEVFVPESGVVVLLDELLYELLPPSVVGYVVVVEFVVLFVTGSVAFV